MSIGVDKEYCIGFTGTQRGMSLEQKFVFERIIRGYMWDPDNGPYRLYHGDCIGADFDAHTIASDWHMDIYIHPPEIDTKRAFCESLNIYPPAPYLLRNKRIVEMTDLLIATPGEPDEQLRSGTWSTVRYARDLGRTIHIIRPDGTVLTENW
jgi:hypothetical protein